MPHNVELPQSVVDRAIEKRGRRNVFDRFEPDKTALLEHFPIILGHILS